MFLLSSSISHYSTVLWFLSYNKVVTSYSNYGVNLIGLPGTSPPVLLRNEISSTCHVFVDPLSTFTLFTLRAVHSWIVLWQCTVRLFNWVPTYSCTQPKFDLNADIYCVVLKKHLDSSMCLQFKKYRILCARIVTQEERNSYTGETFWHFMKFDKSKLFIYVF